MCCSRRGYTHTHTRSSYNSTKLCTSVTGRHAWKAAPSTRRCCPRTPSSDSMSPITAAYSRLPIEELAELQLILREYTQPLLLQDHERRIRAAQLTAAPRLATSDFNDDRRRFIRPCVRPGCPGRHDSRLTKELFVDSGHTLLRRYTQERGLACQRQLKGCGRTTALRRYHILPTGLREALPLRLCKFPSHLTTCGVWKHEPLAQPYERVCSAPKGVSQKLLKQPSLRIPFPANFLRHGMLILS